jgi:hypothetical protein
VESNSGNDIPTYTEIRKRFYYSDGSLFWKKTGKRVGRVQKDKYAKVCINYKTYYLHRLIFLYHHGYLPKEIDHIDRDKTNNRIENLRVCSREQNIVNSHTCKRNRSNYKGVSYQKSSGKYRAFFRGQYLGIYDNKHDAAEEYNKAAVKMFGDFAKLNQIERE